VYLVLAASYDYEDLKAPLYQQKIDLASDFSRELILSGIPAGYYAIALAYYLDGTSLEIPGDLARAFVFPEAIGSDPQFIQISEDYNLGNLVLLEYYSASGSFSFAGFETTPSAGRVIVILATSNETENLQNPVARAGITINGSIEYDFQMDCIFPGNWAVVLLHYEDGTDPENETLGGINNYGDGTQFFELGPENGEPGTFTINRYEPQA
jgi:hypothetical protein